MTRITGTNLKVIFVPTGGTLGVNDINLHATYTTYSDSRQTDMADVTAGNEGERVYIATIEDMTFDVSFYDNESDTDYANYADILPKATGELFVYPIGNASGSPFHSFNVVLESFNHDHKFDGATECKVSGKRTGAMVNEIGSTVP